MNFLLIKYKKYNKKYNKKSIKKYGIIEYI